MRRMQTIKGYALTHHIQLIFLQLRQSGAVSDMPDGDVHALGFNEPQGLLKASKLISSVLLVIRICRSEMREDAFDVDARQRRG